MSLEPTLCIEISITTILGAGLLAALSSYIPRTPQPVVIPIPVTTRRQS